MAMAITEERQQQDGRGRRRYRAPSDVQQVRVEELLAGVRTVETKAQARLPGAEGGVFVAGDVSLLKLKSVAIVGSREVSEPGAIRARKLARQLAERGIVVMSGLAEGVDRNAHEAAIEAGGKTIAVIGTGMDRVYPAAHAELQERIYRDHLLVTPFKYGAHVYPGNFPARNKLMAALSDATCIIEASDKSGSLHQAAECTRLGRWLFILRSVAENPKVSWPMHFLESRDADRVRIVDTIDDITAVL